MLELDRIFDRMDELLNNQKEKLKEIQYTLQLLEEDEEKLHQLKKNFYSFCHSMLNHLTEKGGIDNETT